MEKFDSPIRPGSLKETHASAIEPAVHSLCSESNFIFGNWFNSTCLRDRDVFFIRK
jgi:hypothetical protein